MTVAAEWTQEQEEQAMAALERANHVRSTNASLLRLMRMTPRREAAIWAASLLRNPPPTMGALDVRRFLTTVPGIGAVKAQQMLREAQISRALPRVRHLTMRERDALAKQLDERGRRWASR